MKKNKITKVKIILLMIFIFTLSIFLSSCKKNLDYEICGFYVELVEIDEMNINDKNPKIYFKKDDNNMLSTKIGQVGKVVSFNSTSKVVDEENRKFIFSTTLSIPDEVYDKINIRLITYQNGKYYVDENVYQTINLKGTCKYASTYSYKNDSYTVQFQIKIEIKE